ncbi:MAG: hypothetical protein ACI90U_003054 [Pseudomonadales bacterium]|jgi:hypothetical protein
MFKRMVAKILAIKNGREFDSIANLPVSDFIENSKGITMPIADYNESPFFILGSVRSGTTMLRDMLRLHKKLECPEETHFFRWSDPFGTERYDNYYRASKFFESHRKIDGINNIAFHCIRQSAYSRKDMMDWYGQQYLLEKNNATGRWFDKTPQNAYGILMLSAMYPDAKFIHIHRNPLNVVASLLEGAVMPEHSLTGAINAWLESIMIVHQYKQLAPDRVLDLSYENLTKQPREYISKVLEFISEDSNEYDFSKLSVHPEKNKYLKKLTGEQIEEINRRTDFYRTCYGYED